MKANSTKRKIFDAVDLLTEDTSSQMPVKTMKGGVTMLDIDSIKPFHNHPFHLYEGDRLDDMVESIRDHGILNPVIVREIDDGYEMLSGHNRQKAAKIAGLKKIPAIIKYDLPDTDAYVYVIETNLMQRSFSDLEISEKAAVLKERYDKVLYQRQRESIMAEVAKLEGKPLKGGHGDHHFNNRDEVGKEYGLSGSSVGSQYRMENRCEICGSNGKSMRCPLRVKNHDYTGAPGQKKTIAVKCEECPYGYNRLFRPMNGKLNFSTLDVQDGEGNVDSFEPESKKYSNADTYIRLLKDLGDYVTEHYPKYAKYVELINLLGSEYDMKTASQIMGKADSTLYDWVKRLRPIYDEFRETVDYL